MSNSVEKDTHDAECEREYTPNGCVFIDCMCHIRLAKAEAWDEGERAGWKACYESGEVVNPYRALSSEGSES